MSSLVVIGPPPGSVCRSAGWLSPTLTVRILPVLASRIQLAGKARASITYVPADRLPSLAERLGYLVAVESLRDELHDLALRGRQAAEHMRDPFLVFPRDQLVVLSAFLAGNMSLLDEAAGYPAGSACLVLDEVVDRSLACVGERRLAPFPAPEYLHQGFRGRVLGFLECRAGVHRSPYQLPE